MATSVVDLMKGLGVDSKQEARKLIFEKMTGKTYTASAEDNIKLKSLVEKVLFLIISHHLKDNLFLYGNSSLPIIYR